MRSFDASICFSYAASSSRAAFNSLAAAEQADFSPEQSPAGMPESCQELANVGAGKIRSEINRSIASFFICLLERRRLRLRSFQNCACCCCLPFKLLDFRILDVERHLQSIRPGLSVFRRGVRVAVLPVELLDALLCPGALN